MRIGSFGRKKSGLIQIISVRWESFPYFTIVNIGHYAILVISAGLFVQKIFKTWSLIQRKYLSFQTR